jgi:ABC-type Fe3+-siderophore transport system, permease component
MVVKPVTRRRLWTSILFCLLVLLAVAVTAPLVGSTRIDYTAALTEDSIDREILFRARIPRVLLSLMAGGVLSVCGVLFQALLRDALATPYTLGVSSGASLGAVTVICFGLELFAGFPSIWVGALIGAFLALLLVLVVASEGRRMSSFTLLLSGVTINSICLALILFLQTFATFGQSFAIVRWLMGGIESVEYSTLLWLAAVTFPVLAYVFLTGREWNLMAVGEEWAAARGVNVTRLMLTGLISGSILTGVVTALTGPIGFVGLIVPHGLRMRLGADHRLLLPCSFLLGAAFLTVCDTASRTLPTSGEVPVGVLTALLGGPFFIWLLKSRRRSLWL